jgi:hypothetical protein
MNELTAVQKRIGQANLLIEYISGVGHRFFRHPYTNTTANFFLRGERLLYDDERSQKVFDILDDGCYSFFGHGHTLYMFVRACAGYIVNGNLYALSRHIDACDELGVWADKESTGVIVAQWAMANGLYMPPLAKGDSETVTDGAIFKALGELVDSVESGGASQQKADELIRVLGLKMMELRPSHELVIPETANKIQGYAHVVALQHISLCIAWWYRDYQQMKLIGLETDIEQTQLGQDCLSNLNEAIRCLAVKLWT